MKNIIIGSYNIDILITPLNESKSISTPSSIKMQDGGVAFNIAKSLSEDEIETNLICSIAKNNSLQETNKFLNIISLNNSKKNSIYIELVEKEIRGFSDTEITEEIMTSEKIINTLTNLKEKPFSITLDGNLTKECINTVINFINEKFKQTLIFVNTTSPSKALRFKDVISKIDVLITNKEEFEVLFGNNILLEDFNFNKINFAPKKALIVTNGKEAIYTFTNEKHFKTSIAKVNCSEANGAGDYFMGKVIAGFIKNNLQEANESLIKEASFKTNLFLQNKIL